jgi:hypothetical protein
LMHTAVMIPAAPSKPVMIRCVRLLYFVIGEVTRDGQSSKNAHLIE